MPEFKIGHRWVGDGHLPLVVAEAGIGHGGSIERAFFMVDDARKSGAELVKIQTHCSSEMTEMHPWRHTIDAASFTEYQERALKSYVERSGMMFMSTPFSTEAAERLGRLGVPAFKIGSGECSNLPLIECAASFGKPVILSTGMHDMSAIADAVDVIRKAGVPYALMHCTSEYPTQYANVRLGALAELRESFDDAVIGLSCHSLGIATGLAAVSLGASIIEKHFKCAASWDGPDAEVSITPHELADLISGSRAIHAAMGGTKEPLACEASCAEVALHRVVTTRAVRSGEPFTRSNTTLRRTSGPGMLARHHGYVLTKTAKTALGADTPVTEEHLA